MPKILTPLALFALLALTAPPVVAQTLVSAAGTRQSPFATPPLTMAAADLNAETGRGRVSRAKHRRHAHGARGHRTARHHRNRWRDVWVYSYDRHGYRHYEYVRRKFGGYFARGRADCGCRRGSHGHYRTHHRHL
jgi:hypothetical protein